MNGEEFKKELDKIYAIGFKNGQIEMKNKILKSINRDWTLIPDAILVIKLLKKISNIKLSKKFTKNLYK